MSEYKAHYTLREVGCLLSFVIAAAVLSACRSTVPEQTATAVHERAAMEIESLRSTATVVRARMQTTLEYAGTRVAQANEAGEFLRFSLNRLGTDSDFIETSVKELALLATVATVAAATRPADAARIGVTPVDPPSAVPIASATLAPVEATPTTDHRPRVENPVLATGVGNDDCALDSNPRFTPESSEIYVVVDVYNVAAGSTIESSWKRQGSEVARFSFQPEHAINGNCIWFFIDKSDAAFTVGSWSVQIFVDGVSVTSPLAFQIAEA